MATATVILFKPGGKYYTSEEWEIPELVPHVDEWKSKAGLKHPPLGPWDMEHSKDFHRINDGPVLVPSQEPWGYPHLLVKYVVEDQDK